ncbi:RNA polymerase sigma factor [Sunxiuqinia sp. A32]|uniref:RNA polymerase sigma factor n=1 Tax=Sunxiuqinia sp. A32 TaxID=3461496 RepID=UPI0040467584
MESKDQNSTPLNFIISDYSSFNQIFNLYYSRLCAYVFEITQNANASEDIVQEVFIKLWNGRDKLIITESIFAYLLKASRNGAFNYLRGEASRKKTMEEFPQDTGSSINDALEEQEFIDFVKQCIDELPERSKQVFLMSRFEGFKQKEIAEKLGTSIKTIKNQIWKSLQYLKSCLETKDAI